MELQFAEEFVKENNLTEEQLNAVKSHIETSYIPELKKNWDGKANEHAEGILTGASKYAMDKFGLNIEREKGEKWADYLTRISESGFEATKKKLEEKQAEYDEKLKNFKGGDEYKAQLEKLTNELDTYKKQVAELEPLKGLDQKLQEKDQQLTGLKKEVAYNSVKPNFPDTVNPYEAKAKWDEFKKGVEEKYNLEIVDGQAVAVDKENVHKTFKLSELVEKDSSITDLLKGRQQGGTGGEPTDGQVVEGLPFKVAKGETTESISEKLNTYLVKKLGSKVHDDYPTEFAKLFAIAKKASV